MNRRELIRSALQSAAGAAVVPAAALGEASAHEGLSDAPKTAVPSSGAPSGLMGSEAEAGYFSESALQQALGTARLERPKVEVVAFNFPSWHASPYMEEHFGKGWTEYDTLRNARPLFPGHTMPHYPLWGYYDESDPAWAAREVDLAATYGVDAWMVDWYWHDGLQFYHEQLERGLLKADNRDKLKFAIMWANHDWKNVYPARSPQDSALLLAQKHSIKDFEAVCDYCAEHYFSQPNYLKFDDAHVFGIFDAGRVLHEMGGADGMKQALDALRARAAKLGFALHLQECNGWRHDGGLRALGFDSTVVYGTMGWSYGSKPPGSRIPYGVAAREALESWAKERGSVDVPFHPTCSVGWDDSPRFGERACVAINRSPDQFERLVRAARHFAAGQKGRKFVYVGAWNEWTEDGVLLPDTIWGYSYLESLRRATRD
jgi:hypothetical protein